MNSLAVQEERGPRKPKEEGSISTATTTTTAATTTAAHPHRIDRNKVAVKKQERQQSKKTIENYVFFIYTTADD